eukprot:272523_1
MCFRFAFQQREMLRKKRDESYSSMKKLPTDWTNSSKLILSNPVMLDYNKFIISIQKDEGPLSTENREDGLYEYNVNTDNWCLFIKYPIQFASKRIKSLLINKKSNESYLCGSNTLIILNYKTQKYEIYKNNDIGNNPTAIMINSQFCLITFQQQEIQNIDNKICHLLWDKNDKKFNKLLYDVSYLYTHTKFLHIKYKHKIFMFCELNELPEAEVNGVDDSGTLCVLSYDLNQNKMNSNIKWNLLDVKFPDLPPIDNMNILLTNNKKYILFFGEPSIFSSDGIYGLELDTMKFKYSNLGHPNNWSYHTISITIPSIKNLLIFGFIRKLNIYFSKDIIQLIQVWYNEEKTNCIYLIGSFEMKAINSQTLINTLQTKT